MPSIYCPNPYPNPQTEREVLLVRLWKCGAMIPEHEKIDISWLRDIVAWQEDNVKTARPKKFVVDVELAREITEWRRKKGLNRQGVPTR